MLYTIDITGEQSLIVEWNKHNGTTYSLILCSLYQELKPIYEIHDTAKRTVGYFGVKICIEFRCYSKMNGRRISLL